VIDDKVLSPVPRSCIIPNYLLHLPQYAIILFMKTKQKFLVISYVILLFAGCNKSENPVEPCGDNVNTDWALFFNGNSDTAVGHMWYQLIGNYKAQIEFYGTYTEICTDEHVNVSANITKVAGVVCEVKATVGLCPGVSDDVIPLTSLDAGLGRIAFMGSISSGLKQCYDAGPGRFWVKAYFTFPMQGTRALDMKYFLDSVKPKIDYTISYSKYKAR